MKGHIIGPVCVCMFVYLGVLRAHYTPLQRYMGYLCTRKAQYAPLRRSMHHGAQGRLCFLQQRRIIILKYETKMKRTEKRRVIISPRYLSVCRLSRADAVDRLLIM